MTGMHKIEPILQDENAAKVRTCLRCSKDFQSLGPGNRICPDCKDNLRMKPLSKRDSSERGATYRKGGINGHN